MTTISRSLRAAVDRRLGRRRATAANRRRPRVVVFNGEIYNHASCAAPSSVRAIVSLRPLRHRSAPPRLRGVGARAVEELYGRSRCDRRAPRKLELFLARDRFGIKPLYYVAGRRARVRVRSSGALRGPARGRELDHGGLRHFLTLPRASRGSTRSSPVCSACRPGTRCWCDPDGIVEIERTGTSAGDTGCASAAATTCSTRGGVGRSLQTTA